jgi:hypothetical protein
VWKTYVKHKVKTPVIGDDANITYADSFPAIFDRKSVIRFRDPQRGATALYSQLAIIYVTTSLQRE